MVDFCRFFGWLVVVQNENIHLTNFDVAVRRCTVSLSLWVNLYIVHCLTGDHPHASIAKFEASRLCFVVNEFLSNFVATDVYALFNSPLEKIAT